MIYHDPQDLELGYVDEDDVHHSPWGPVLETNRGPIALEPVYTCGVCGNDIEDPEEAVYPLCGSCMGTAKAHAREFPEGPERFTHTRKTR